MAKRIKRQVKQHGLLQIWWSQTLLAIVVLAISYGFISWAIDSGELWQYAVGLLLAYWAIAHLIRGLKHAFSR